jgi:peptidoglycan/LPS O-acetylase OafA/YrhL
MGKKRGSSDGRNHTVDAVRCLAAFGVVSIHVAPNTPSGEVVGAFFGVFVVPFFYLISLYFFIRGLSAKDPWLALHKQVLRVAVPYLSWTLIYIALFALKSRLTHQPHTWDLRGIFAYGQSAVHLYFMPVLLALLFLSFAVSLIIGGSVREKIFGAICVLGVLIFSSNGAHHGYFGWTWWWIELPLYCAIAFVFARTSFLQGNTVLLVGLGAASFIAAQILAWKGVTGWPHAFGDLLGGLGALLLALKIEIRHCPRFLPTLAAATYGIYLSHFVFLEGFEFVLQKVKLLPDSYDLVTKLLLTSVVFVVAAVFTFVVRRIPWGRKLLLGEFNPPRKIA